MIAKINILLVDDDPVCHFISTKILQQLGLSKIHTAANGQEALTLIGGCTGEKESSPSIIFVDLDMPILDGFGFIEAYKKLNTPRKDKTSIAILTSSYS